MSDEQSIGSVYAKRRDRFKRMSEEMDRRFDKICFLRLSAFIIAAFCLILGFGNWRPHPSWLIVAAVFFSFFAFFVWLHDRAKRGKLRCRELWHINQQALEKLARNWPKISKRSSPVEISPLAYDLDLFGHASLFQLMSIAGTECGREILGKWLVTSATPREVQMRQEAAKEMAGQLDLLQEFHLLGNFVEKCEGKAEPFLTWVEEKTWLTRKSPLVWLCRMLAATTCLSLAIQIFGFVESSPWLLLFVFNLLISLSLRGKLNKTFARASSLGDCLESYGQSLKLLSNSKFSAPLLQNIQKSLQSGKTGAHLQIQRLRQLVRLSDMRYSMLHFVVEGLTLWDVHMAFRLEIWRTSNRRVRDWLMALGQVEAIASLASLAHAHPKWAFPTIAPGEKTIEAKQLGHPLLPPAKRVDNDISLGAPGSFLLVTGSNMSGKSTLLRAIGVNAVLAQSGAPVCATSLILPPLDLASSMRVQDSLEQGVSSYMAQLKSLARVVDAARKPRESEKILLYLLDEILQGTNTGERQIAVRIVMKHLLGKNAIGAMSTHDLDLAKDKALAKACRAIHFKETINSENGKGSMTFDYKIRPGVATTTNALKLLELVGLDFENGEKQ